MMRYRLDPLKATLLVAVLVVMAMVAYDAASWRQLVTMEGEVSMLREQVVSMKRVGDVDAVRQELAIVEQRLTEEGVTPAGERSRMDNVELLKKVAGENEVEIVNVFCTGISDRDSSRLTYSLQVRAGMERLITFLEALENKGLDGVVIDRVSARRQGGEWETNLDVTGYFSATSFLRDDGARN